MLSDSYLFDAGWLFFAAFTLVVAVVVVTAFRRDLFPSSATLEAEQQSLDRVKGENSPLEPREGA